MDLKRSLYAGGNARSSLQASHVVRFAACGRRESGALGRDNYGIKRRRTPLISATLAVIVVGRPAGLSHCHQAAESKDDGLAAKPIAHRLPEILTPHLFSTYISRLKTGSQSQVVT